MPVFDIENFDVKRLAHRVLNCDYPDWLFGQSYTLKTAIKYHLNKMNFYQVREEDIDALWEILNMTGVRDKFIKKYLAIPRNIS